MWIWAIVERLVEKKGRGSLLKEAPWADVGYLAYSLLHLSCDMHLLYFHSPQAGEVEVACLVVLSSCAAYVGLLRAAKWPKRLWGFPDAS